MPAVEAVSTGSTREGADLFAEVRVSLRKGLAVSVLDVWLFHPGPLCAREQGVVGPRCQARGVEGAPGKNSCGRSPASRLDPTVTTSPLPSG